MRNKLYIACDGGQLTTLAGTGGILEISLNPEIKSRYFEFPDGMGGSTHMVLANPSNDTLVASSANIGQIFVIPRKGDTFDFENYRTIQNFNDLGPPEKGTDAQTAMFDFIDNDHIVTQYNRKLIQVNIRSGEIEVLADFKAFNPDRADFFHQVSVIDEFIVVDEVIKGGIFIYNQESKDMVFMGDGFPGGHHLAYLDENGDPIIIRPSFGFNSVDGHLKIDDNSISFFNLRRKKVRTLYYGWEIPNHFPIDLFINGNDLYISFSVPGSICKLDIRTGRILARFSARPCVFIRYLSMLSDALYFLLDYGTTRNRFDNTVSNINQFAHAFSLGRQSGTRAGFFSMVFDPEKDQLYACHRGLNKIFCLNKVNLQPIWSSKLPSRQSNMPMVGWWYRLFPYFTRCLGVHHGTIVSFSDQKRSGQ